jgi:hypothetical protein
MDRALRFLVLFFVAALAGCGTLPGVIDPGPAPNDAIRVDSPRPGDRVTSPLVVRGSARGSWYFEATFPVTLLDARGAVIARSYAQAQGEWMTSDFVPFTSTLTFATPTTADGTLVLDAANASGDPARAQSVRVPVKFATTAGATSGATGYAHVGPTCPVESSPPDPACADRPYVGTFVVESVGGRAVTDVTTGNDGRFSVGLAPGSYNLRLRSNSVMPSLAPVAFTVREGAWTTLDLALDSGIR